MRTNRRERSETSCCTCRCKSCQRNAPFGEVYQRPYDESRPLVCFDAGTTQWVKDVRESIPAAPAQGRYPPQWRRDTLVASPAWPPCGPYPGHLPAQRGEAFGHQVGIRVKCSHNGGEEGLRQEHVLALDIPGDLFDVGPQLHGAR